MNYRCLRFQRWMVSWRESPSARCSVRSWGCATFWWTCWHPTTERWPSKARSIE